jgi:hypothetical protein
MTLGPVGTLAHAVMVSTLATRTRRLLIFTRLSCFGGLLSARRPQPFGGPGGGAGAAGTQTHWYGTLTPFP